MRDRIRRLLDRLRAPSASPDPGDDSNSAERNASQAERLERIRRILSENPDALEHVVDNRVFLLGLDELYRTAMMHHESTELLACAERVAAALGVAPADVPVEGYYSESRRLTEYFRLVRALQAVSEHAAERVARMHEFQRLASVFSSPIYGHATNQGGLFPGGRDPLTVALDEIGPDISSFTITSIVERAHRIALETDDFSLVGLAAVARDAVLITALRESVVLYAAVAVMSRQYEKPSYVWQVDDALAERGKRFVATFNALFDEDLPEPVAANANRYFEAADEDAIVGRCVRVAMTPPPERFYHWAVRRAADGSLAVEDFWDTEVWTTDMYRERLENLM